MAITALDGGKIRSAMPGMGRFFSAAAALGLGVCLVESAWAGLGEGADSVQHDQTALHGTTLSVTPMASYDLQETTTAAGTRVREYVSHAGTVFAVTWSGPRPPDLSVVLASHYQDFYKAAAAHHGSHKVFTMASDGLVLSFRKLPRGVVGEAHVPALLPTGVSAQDIR